MKTTTKSKSQLSVEPLTPTIGAEIFGIDLATPTADDIAVVAEALHNHLVVFFRNQHLNDRAHRDFAANFGPVRPFPYSPPVDPEVPEVHSVHSGGPGPKITNADVWHTDATMLICPPMGSILRSVVLPPSGGDTLFASMYAAYEALSPRVQDFLSDMTATHELVRPASIVPEHEPLPPAHHPVVRTHPVTGRKALFVNRIYTQRLDGLSDRENDALLPFLCDHVRSPDFQCRFRWREGSVAFWDNRCAQHYATYDYSERRVMHRVVIEGDKPS